MVFRCGCARSMRGGVVSIFAAGALAAAAPVEAAPVPVANYSFEEPVVVPYQFPGWSNVTVGSAFAYSDRLTGLPSHQGMYVAGLSGYGYSADAAIGISQNLRPSVSVGEIYTMTVAAGGIYYYGTAEPLELQFRIADNIVATQTFTSLSIDKINDYALVYQVPFLPPDGSLSIAILSPMGAKSGAILVDDVRVDVTTVPEPTLIAPGTIAAAWLLRRRRGS